MTSSPVLALTLCAALAVTACGGGGGGGAAPDAPVVAVEPCAVGNLASTTEPAVNALRAIAQSCGGVSYPAVPDLAWDNRLARAAQAHSDDMARNRFLGHTGSDGLQLADRVGAQGYTWTVVAENLTQGPATLPAALAAWMGSSGHCQNVMRSTVTEVGLACSKQEGAGQPFYWTMVLAAP